MRRVALTIAFAILSGVAHAEEAFIFKCETVECERELVAAEIERATATRKQLDEDIQLCHAYEAVKPGGKQPCFDRLRLLDRIRSAPDYNPITDEPVTDAELRAIGGTQ